MTRLTENDIAGIEAEWATYERRLEELMMRGAITPPPAA